MKKLRVEVSNEEFATLEHLAQALAELPFEPIGFGMWADRPEMQDATKWVDDLREREWRR